MPERFRIPNESDQGKPALIIKPVDFYGAILHHGVHMEDIHACRLRQRFTALVGKTERKATAWLVEHDWGSGFFHEGNLMIVIPDNPFAEEPEFDTWAHELAYQVNHINRVHRNMGTVLV